MEASEISIVDPQRAAHRTQYAFLYQAALAVEAWLSLDDDTTLVCEGDEDFDLRRPGLEEAVQIKVASAPIGIADEQIKKSVRAFARTFVVRQGEGKPVRFRFVTSAPGRASRAGIDLRVAWHDADQARRERFVASLRELVDADSRAWLDAQSERWHSFAGAIHWVFDEIDLFAKLRSLADVLRDMSDTKGLPAELLRDRLLVAVLDASSRPEVADRCLTAEDRRSIFSTSRSALEAWARSPETLHRLQALNDARRLSELLVSGTREAPDPPQSVAHLLAAAYEVVPFDESLHPGLLKGLVDWCDGQPGLDVQLLIGPGGSGKTRLAIELARRLRAIHWYAGFLSDTVGGKHSAMTEESRPSPTVDELFRGDGPRLIIIDYAETKRELVLQLLTAIGEKSDGWNGPRVRVLLVARNAGDWWQATLAQRGSIEWLKLIRPWEMPSIATTAASRELVFRSAMFEFAGRLRSDARTIGAVDLSDESFTEVLFLHMAALAAVEGRTVRGRDDLLDETLAHEGRFWTRASENSARLGEPAISERTIRQAIAALTLIGGGLDEQEAYEYLARATAPRSWRDEDQVVSLPRLVTLLRSLYSGDMRGRPDSRYLSGLEPDILGERFVAKHLEADADEPLRPGERRRLLDALFPEPEDANLPSAFVVLGRAAAWQPSAVAPLRTLITPAEQRAIPATLASLAIGDSTAHSPLGAMLAAELQASRNVALAGALLSLMPRESVSLRELGAWAAGVRLADLGTSSSEEANEERASALSAYSVRVSQLGRREQALRAAEEAVTVYRRLASARPDAFEPALAMSLNNLGNTLSELGRREEALRAAEEAVTAYRRLASARPDAFEPYLAASLNNLANRLSELGRREEALRAAEESVTVYRRLASARPDAFEPYLAGSLNNLANRLSELGRREEALRAAEESVTVYRRLASARPDAFEPYLAGSLNNLANRLSELGRREEALRAAEEAVVIRRRLTSARPDAFEPDLGMSLCNLGNRLSSLGRREEALRAAEEAVAIRRRLASARPDAFEPHLAVSLNSLGAGLSQLGRREEALRAAEEAVTVYRRLASARPDAFEPDLAMSLNNLGAMLSALGRREEALRAATEAVAVYRRLASARPDAFEPDLAGSLNNLGISLNSLGRREEALRAAEEAVVIRRRLASARPDAFEPDLAMSLSNLGNTLNGLGQREEALHAAEEAVVIRRRLASARPDAFEPDLAAALTNLGARLSELGRHEEALRAAEEAAAVYHRLATARMDAFEPGLAASLHNLGATLSKLERREEALRAAEEAVVIRRRLASARPDAFEPDLAGSLSNLSNTLSELGRREEALRAAEEAVTIYVGLTERQPAAHAQKTVIATRGYLRRCEEGRVSPNAELLLRLQAALKPST